MKENRKKLLKGIGITAVAAGTVYGINRLVFFLSTVKELLTSKEKSYYSWRFVIYIILRRVKESLFC